MVKQISKFNFGSKLALTILLISIILFVSIIISALTPGVSPNPGHDIQTVSPPLPCAANQYLQFDGNNWKCASPGDITGVSAGTGLSGGGLSGDVAVSADTNYLQRKLTLDPNVYNTGTNYGTLSVNMGNHLFCFLTRINIPAGSAIRECTISLDTTWYLRSTNDATCSARCID